MMNLHNLCRHSEALCPMEVIVAVTAQCNYTSKKNHSSPLKVSSSALSYMWFTCCLVFVVYPMWANQPDSWNNISVNIRVQYVEPDCLVAGRFKKQKHDVSTLGFYGIERVVTAHCGANYNLLLKRREDFWIYTSQKLSPEAPNVEFLLNCTFWLCIYIYFAVISVLTPSIDLSLVSMFVYLLRFMIAVHFFHKNIIIDVVFLNLVCKIWIMVGNLVVSQLCYIHILLLCVCSI